MTRVLCVGHAVQDFVFSLPALPSRASKYAADVFASVGGGPAASAAVAIGRLGGEAVLAARVGEDAVAGLIVEELARERVDCRWVRRMTGCASSISAVFVDAAGERLIVNHADARMPASADWLPDPSELGARAVLADTRWPEGALRSLELARERNIPGVLDADRPLPRGFEQIYARASHVAFSADGFEDFLEARGGARRDAQARDALRELSLAHDGTLLVTLGAAGLIMAQRGTLRAQPAFDVPVVDTLGAGDVWHGAFALALAEEHAVEQACRWASAAAAVKVQRRGGRAGAPRRDEVERLTQSAV